MPDILHRDPVLEQCIVDRIGKRQIAQFKKACRDEGQRVGGRQAAILVQSGPGFGQDSGGQRDAALRLRLQEMQALALRVLKDTDHVVAAHCHIAMVFPAQTLDRSTIAVAVRIDPFSRVDLAQIAGADRLRGRELVPDECRRGRLAEAGERPRHMLFRRIVPRHDSRCRLNPYRKARRLPGHYRAQVRPNWLIDRTAPIVKMRHALPLATSSWDSLLVRAIHARHLIVSPRF